MNHPPDIELSVRLTDDSFESKIVVPTGSTREQLNGLVAAWFGLLDAGLKMIKIEEGTNKP